MGFKGSQKNFIILQLSVHQSKILLFSYVFNYKKMKKTDVNCHKLSLYRCIPLKIDIV